MYEPSVPASACSMPVLVKGSTPSCEEHLPGQRPVDLVGRRGVGPAEAGLRPHQPRVAGRGVVELEQRAADLLALLGRRQDKPAHPGTDRPVGARDWLAIEGIVVWPVEW